MPIKIYMTPFFLSRQHSVCSGEVLPENSKKGKRGAKVLNLISFELGALEGKLMLIPYLF
jgi:hypothetical protein